VDRGAHVSLRRSGPLRVLGTMSGELDGAYVGQDGPIQGRTITVQDVASLFSDLILFFVVRNPSAITLFVTIYRCDATVSLFDGAAVSFTTFMETTSRSSTFRFKSVLVDVNIIIYDNCVTCGNS